VEKGNAAGFCLVCRLSVLFWSDKRKCSQVMLTPMLRCPCQITYSPGLNTYYFKNIPKSVTMKYMETLARQRLPSFYKKAGGIVLFLFGKGVNVVEEGANILCEVACGFHYGHRRVLCSTLHCIHCIGIEYRVQSRV